MEKILKVPYFSQRDNRLNPGGSCNVTSIAMCLHYLGIRGDGSQPQLEDQLYQRCLDRGLSRHDPLDLKVLAESYPKIRDEYTAKGSIEMICQAIDKGHPCVIHGYFTKFGHIVVAKGYNDQGLVVNDPWGEWYSWGYDQRVSGEGLTYSYGMISRLCSPEGPRNIWLHRLSRTS